MVIPGFNSRLDTFQAVVGNWIIPKAVSISNQRIKNANYLDKKFRLIPQINIPPRIKGYRLVYHLYILFAKNRDKLLKYCINHGIEAKIHYPIPIYLQKGLKELGHKKGDFPIAERMANTSVSLPVHEFISENQVKYIAQRIKEFYLR